MPERSSRQIGVALTVSEMTCALNYLSYFLLTSLVLERLWKTAQARIINVSSCAHESPGRFRLEDLREPSSNRGYPGYKRSKFCNYPNPRLAEVDSAYTKAMLSLEQSQNAIAAMTAGFNRNPDRRKVDMTAVDDDANPLAHARYAEGF